MSELLLCLTQEDGIKPYLFKTTAIKVFSFEEALFHCYTYWKQSLNDFCGEEFIEWVRISLKLGDLAKKIKDISGNGDSAQRLYMFLSLIDYFDSSELHSLRAEVERWQKRNDWEKLKEQGDYFVQKGEPDRAIGSYRAALGYEVNAELLNNTAIALMQLERFDEAAECLERASECVDPEKSEIVLLHLIEAYIFDKEIAKATLLINDVKNSFGDSPELHYLRGETDVAAGNCNRSVTHYERAIELDKRPEYIYRLAQIYSQIRMFDKAMETLELVKVKNIEFLMKQAELHAAANNVPAAIKCMEKAIVKERNNVDLWTGLAMYHRMDYDLQKAYSAIIKALDLSKDNYPANLELARISKAQGKIKDYRAVLKIMLQKFRDDYRQTGNNLYESVQSSDFS